MGFLPEGTISGNYPPIGDRGMADVRLVFECSHRPDTKPPGLPNIEIALGLQTDHDRMPLPVFASLSIVRAIEYIRADVNIVEIFKGPSAHGFSENTGTWGELNQSVKLMQQYGYSHPELQTSRYNIGNIARQAGKLGLEPIIPKDLPGSFDPESDQLWTRSLWLWRLAAYPRIYRLKKAGH